MFTIFFFFSLVSSHLSQQPLKAKLEPHLNEIICFVVLSFIPLLLGQFLNLFIL